MSKGVKGRCVRSLAVVAVAAMVFSLAGCDEEDVSGGSLDNSAFTMSVYDNSGGLAMTSRAKKISMSDKLVDAGYYSGVGAGVDSDGTLSGTVSAGSVEEQSSLVVVNLDGREFDSCGDTLVFTEDGLEPVKGFDADAFKGDGKSDTAPLNRLKGLFPKRYVVVVKSQTGTPIEAFNGDEVKWGICDDLPKTTKVRIDGKLLYIHRANFQVMDRDSL